MTEKLKIVLYDNSEKAKGKEPKFAGYIKDGDTIVYNVACWVQTSKAGKKYLSGSVEKPKPKTEQDGSINL